jgi:glucokinase-like ROK family protein
MQALNPPDSGSISPLVNRLRVLNMLRVQGPMSRADLARNTGLTKATVSRLISDLEAKNLIHATGVSPLVRGRHPVIYEFNASSGAAIGVEVQPEGSQVIVTDLAAAPLASFYYTHADTRVETFVQDFQRILSDVRAQVAADIVGVGIGVPGIYDYEREKVILAEHLGWIDVELARLIEEQTHLETYVVNRANAAALSEKWYGVGKGYNDFVYISIRSGIGSGIIIGGELYWGANGSAGEVGHFTVIPDGPLCRCGKRGCLEALASTTAITAHAKQLVKSGQALLPESLSGRSLEDLTIQDVMAAATAGDDAMCRVLNEAARYIGMAVGNVINLFNPQRIILGGMASYAPSSFLDAVRESAQAHSFNIPWRATSSLRDSARNP